MRIVSGLHRGRAIEPPKGFAARPTTDFAKVALFNILEANFDVKQATALDLFSGTGSISYELASRGCPRVDSVELNFKHYAFIKKTAGELGLSQVRCVRADAFSFLRSCPPAYSLIFADPPYDLVGIGQIPVLVFTRQLLAPGGWLVLEHSQRISFAESPHFKEHRCYGSVNFSIFEKKEG
jgi:16S rRNA (guanine(966)-N(2))-methyltransferase RsmD